MDYYWITVEYKNSNGEKRISSYAVWNLDKENFKNMLKSKNVLEVYRISQEEKDLIAELSDLLIYNDNYELQYKYNCLIKEILKDKPNLRNNIKGKTYSLGLFG